MGSTVLPLVYPITAVTDHEEQNVLLGVGDSAYVKRVTQYESLWNSHHLQKNGITVDDVAKNQGGN